jgi:formylglycine-generating enzyme required for sulfatase activity
MRFRSAVLFALLILLIAVPARAEKRIALVIGNKDYKTSVGPLVNPLNDAHLVAGALKSVGFDVLKPVENATRTDMLRAINAFASALKSAGSDAVGFLYYSGHGAASQGENYLIPIDVTEASTDELRILGVKQSEVLDILRTEAPNAAHYLVFDACRNNLQGGARGAKGFVAVEQQNGVLVAFSTAPGKTAQDTGSGSGPYAAALATELVKPGQTDLIMFHNVRIDVIDKTKRDQVPWFEDGIERRERPVFALATSGVKPTQVSPTSGTTQVAVVGPPISVAPPSGPCGNTPVNVSWSSRSAQPLSSAEECALKPKDVFKECDKCPEMVVVPAGSFMMGSPENEEDRSKDESPQHRVTFSQPFAVGKFSITFDEWDACAADGGCNNYKPSDEGWGRGSRPVINVSWDDAKAYVAWLSRKSGKYYRLLSEAEREYITRAATTTPFWWGSSISTGQANYNGNYTYGSGAKGELRQKTVPVDSFQPNPWGLYQVHGNVYDWVEDCYHDTFDGAPPNGSAWTGGDCKYRVLRGGSWYIVPRYLRAASRGRYPIDVRVSLLGFRLGRTLTP